MPTLSSEYSRRFWTAPSAARWVDTASIALSISEMSAVPVLDSEKYVFDTVLPSEIMATEITSPSLAPTWNDTVEVLLSRQMPLNCVVVPMRSISEANWATSDWMADWLVALSVPFLNWTASSRTRCSIECTVWRAPSAVWTSETPSWMLRWFWARPRIWARIFSEMARPAASSAARLIR